MSAANPTRAAARWLFAPAWSSWGNARSDLIGSLTQEDGSARTMPDYATARMNMIEGQLRPNRVVDPKLVAAMADIPRELFVPKSVRGFAYVDEDLEIADGRYLMEPMVFGRLVNDAVVSSTDVVLDIGCGSGYSTAVLSRLANTVVALESDEALARMARDRLKELGVDNAVVIEAPLTEGYAHQGPYDCIFINGAVADIPQVILDQLAGEGRLGTVVAPSGRVGQATIMHRIGGVLSRQILFDASVKWLPGFEPQPEFEF